MPSQDVWKFTPVSYRTSVLWGRCPTLIPLLQLSLKAGPRVPLTVCDPWMTIEIFIFCQFSMLFNDAMVLWNPIAQKSPCVLQYIVSFGAAALLTITYNN